MAFDAIPVRYGHLLAAVIGGAVVGAFVPPLWAAAISGAASGCVALLAAIVMRRALHYLREAERLRDDARRFFATSQDVQAFLARVAADDAADADDDAAITRH